MKKVKEHANMGDIGTYFNCLPHRKALSYVWKLYSRKLNVGSVSLIGEEGKFVLNLKHIKESGKVALLIYRLIL